MPKLNDNVKHNTYKGRTIDKESKEIAYFDDTHEYIDKKDGVKGVSVTTLIHSYSNPFDASFWSSYKAMESLLDEETFKILKTTLLSTKKFKQEYVSKFNIDPKVFEKKKQEILDGYDREREASCELGTKIHAKIEESFYKGNKKEIQKYDLGGNLPVFEGNYELDLKDGIYPEYLISYRKGDFLCCGQIDLMCLNNNELTIIDHKTCKKIEMKSYYNKFTKSSTKMKFPLNNIDDVNGQLYALQMSVYAWMIQQHNPNIKVKRLALHWIDHSGNESFIDVPYLKSDVERMINHYIKHQKIQKELDKDKPIKI